MPQSTARTQSIHSSPIDKRVETVNRSLAVDTLIVSPSSDASKDESSSSMVHSKDSPTPVIVTRLPFSSIEETFTRCMERGRGSLSSERIINVKAVGELLHLRNIESASSDELMFLAYIPVFGPKAAIELAAKSRLKCQRPLRALRATMRESGKSCSEQSAKRKPLSGSSTSLRKR
jgi:hypothetical protein